MLIGIHIQAFSIRWDFSLAPLDWRVAVSYRPGRTWVAFGPIRIVQLDYATIGKPVPDDKTGKP